MHSLVYCFTIITMVAVAPPGPESSAIDAACLARYPADVSGLVNEGEPCDLITAAVDRLTNDPRYASETDAEGNVIRMLGFIGREDYRFTNTELINFLLDAATPGSRFSGIAISALPKADKRFAPAIAERMSTFIVMDKALELWTMRALLGAAQAIRLPLSADAMHIFARIASEPTLAHHMIVNDDATLAHPATPIDERNLHDKIYTLRANAMMTRLALGSADVDLPRYRRLDDAGKTIAGHVVLASMFPGEMVFAKDPKLMSLAIQTARDIFMDPARQAGLEASPVGLWMITITRDDISVSIRRAMLQAMLDNAAASGHQEIIDYAYQVIQNAGFDPKEFLPQK